jgi:SPP1 family predicted phage head-tail adaptor
MSYYPLKIQRMNQETEEWDDLLQLHALKVNKTGGGESYAAGAEQFHLRLTFELRWRKALEDIIHQPQIHRIVYRGWTYNITDYDDFMEQHRMIRLVGEAYG